MILVERQELEDLATAADVVSELEKHLKEVSFGPIPLFDGSGNPMGHLTDITGQSDWGFEPQGEE